MPAPSDQTPGESPTFSDLALGDAVLKALQDVGYESPSPIQAATIPHLLGGRDVVGQAQTGTGKTAAFALPILTKIDVSEGVPQALVLVPTRELAIQVAEAFQKYASYMKGFHVLPVYGGQSYTPQLQSLRRGVQVVVATPGRAMDHIKRGTLNLSSLKHLVLDEADEMLRMGFIDDVEWILEQIPAERQIALFSATMPTQVRRIAQQHLREPAEVTIKSKTTTASQIRQRYWIVSGMHKLDALTRILEAETFDAMIVFTRTKIATEDLAQRLSARGFSVEALNGDIAQQQRERTIARLKSGQIDIVVATDVAARGLDVERVSHVVNYDVPYDPESYVHRIGRTGRAGRSGEAILFIAPRERNMLRVIERTTRQAVQQMQLPTIEDVNERRVARFNEKLTAAIAANAGQPFLSLIESYERDNNVSAAEIAAALASIAQGATPLLLEPQVRSNREPWSPEGSDSGARRERAPRPDRAARNEKYAKRERDLASRELGEEGSSQPERAAWPSSTADDADARRDRAPRSAEQGSRSEWKPREEHASREDYRSGSKSREESGSGEGDSRHEGTRQQDSRSERSPREEGGSRDQQSRSEWSSRQGGSSGERNSRSEWSSREGGAAREWKSREAGASRESGSRSEWAPREGAGSRQRESRFESGAREERAPRQRKARSGFESTDHSEQGAQHNEAADSDQVAAFWNVPRDQEVQSEQTPKPLNRRERRALERAERERLAAGGEAAPGSDAAAAGAGESEVEGGNVDAVGKESAAAASVDASSSEPSERGEESAQKESALKGAHSEGANEDRAHDDPASEDRRASEQHSGEEARPRKRAESRESGAEGTRKRAKSDESEGGERPRKRAEPREFAAGERPRTRSESRDSASDDRPRGRSQDRDFGGGSDRPRGRSQDRDFGGGDARPRGRGEGAGDERRPRRGGDEEVETYRIEVGHDHGVKPGNIVGAIANEAGLEGRHIGRVVIREDHSFVDLPTGMPKEVFIQLQKVRVAGQPLQISRALKTHVEKLRRDRPAPPKFRKQNDSRSPRPSARAPRDRKPRR